MKVINTVAVLSSILPLALGFCCGGDGSGICGDGSKQGAGCCGVGPCNIFCCNCDGGNGKCKGGRSNKRSSNVPEVFKRVDAGTEWTFSEADKSGTGSISLSDYLEYMNIPANNTETHSYWVSWFNQHDTNGDGVITLDEAA